MKAVLSGSGQRGIYYLYFSTFTVRKLRQNFRLYIIHGIAPLPRVKIKFKPQNDDSVNVNNVVFINFGPSVELHHQHLKEFPAYKNPCIGPQYRAKHPNWKAIPLLYWMNYIFLHILRLGVSISFDKTTIGLQGLHQ